MRFFCLFLGILLLTTPTFADEQEMLYAPVGRIVRPPVGWVGFCAKHKQECDTTPLPVLDATLSEESLRYLRQVNTWVNAHITAMSDKEHWDVDERWSYPDDGYGDCEDMVLLKRRMLMQAGWPRQALLITVVRDAEGAGHAVLTVRTDRGEFILNNLTDAILLWHQSGLRFVKRQSQNDPNVWVALDAHADVHRVGK